MNATVNSIASCDKTICVFDMVDSSLVWQIDICAWNVTVKQCCLTEMLHEDFGDHSEYAPSQWEMALHCNAISHWLGAYMEWFLDLTSMTWALTELYWWDCDSWKAFDWVNSIKCCLLTILHFFKAGTKRWKQMIGSEWCVLIAYAWCLFLRVQLTIWGSTH